MKQLGPGIWEQDGELHIDAVEIARAVGHPDPHSDEAQEMAMKAAQIVLADWGLDIPIEVRER